MQPDFFRFSPPPAEVPAAARWALTRAFAPAGTPVEATAEPDQALEWSRRLGLVERIGYRQGREILENELGAAAESFVDASRRSAVRLLLQRQGVEQVAQVGTELSAPVVLLKGMALIEAGAVPYGGRPLADIDILVAPEAAEAVAAALAERGFERSEIRDTDFHLPPLTHPALGTVEVHVYVRGVTLPGGERSEAGRLISAELCRPAAGLESVWLPEPPFLAAHAVAHAIAQHGQSPSGYPLLRLLADLQDLARSRQPQARPSELTAVADRFLTRSVSPRESAAVADLLRHLGDNELPRPDRDAGRFLAHVLAAHLDPNYVPSLKVKAFGGALARGDWRKIVRRVGRSLRSDDGTPAAGSVAKSLGNLVVIGWSWLRQRFRSTTSRTTPR